MRCSRRIVQFGGEIQRTTPDQAQTFIEQQVSLRGRVIKERRISAD
jgi:hypothetical protein